MANRGGMRFIVRFEERASTQEDTGEEQVTWSLVGERWAELMTTTGREIFTSQQRAARVPTQFKLRFPLSFTVKPKMRLTFKGKFFDIISAIDPDGRKNDLIVTCDELVDEPT